MLALAVLAGEKTVGHGGKGYQSHAQFLQNREQALILPGHHRVAVFHRRHRANRMGAAQVFFICLRDAPVGDLALADEIRHHPGHFLRLHCRVDAVLEIEVDVVHP